ncbi:hypothetical protein C7964_102330 [Loktanella sp. PT4BL]|jgi:hypothetical protein|uniref:hypothetical protein n=1 Tax=Loktanella sp. PT4BL TaxID=2135611 RepID=UPI000D76824A|nr:hypothetical protein [Loktanella sp. PT4BL]PXW70443.1 hypothetical protein C7964_102330 [Loktanella sp. PT4BL]
MTEQHSSQSRKQSKEEWDALVKMADLQGDFQVAFKQWITDKSKSQDVVAIGKQLMELQNQTGKSGGRLSSSQVYHRICEAEDCINKGLDQPVAKKDLSSGKLIRKTADGGTTWVLKL